MKWRKNKRKERSSKRPSLALILVALSAVCSPAMAAPAYQEESANELEKVVSKDTDVATLTTQLGDESYAVRVASMTELWSRGAGVLTELHRAAESSDDPEMSSRIDELILYISAGVLPNRSEEVKRLVIDFSRGEIDVKLTIARKLMIIGEWKQVLHLASLEKEPKFRKQMYSLVKEAAAGSARNAIVAGDMKLAREILDLVGDDEQNTLLRAWFYVRNGELKEQLEKADGMEAKKAGVWRMSLHRANGDFKAAMDEAQKAGFHKLAAGMKILDGDPLPWIEKVGESGDVDLALSMGRQIQKAKLLGKNKQADILARELVKMGDDPEAVNFAAIGLAANGYAKEAAGLMATSNVVSVYYYYSNIQRPQECLRSLGIPKGAKPPYKEWVNGITKDAVDDAELQNRLLLLAGFLHNYGEVAHAIEVMRPLMQELEKSEGDGWFDMLGHLSSGGLSQIALTFVKERSAEELVVDKAMVKILVSSNDKSSVWGTMQKRHPEYVRVVWDLLKKRHTEDITQSIHEAALLAGLIPDVNNETDEIHQALLGEVMVPDFPNEVIKIQRLEALYYLAFKRDNVIEASRLIGILGKDQSHWPSVNHYLDAALHRWAKVEATYAEKAKEEPGDYANLVRWSISLRKLGRAGAAQKTYDRALMLTMGNASALRTVGALLSVAGYHKEATEVWEHSLVMSAAGSGNFSLAVGALTEHTGYLYKSKQWGKAAAMHEVKAFQSMSGSSNLFLGGFLRIRFRAEFCRAMHMLENGQRDLAISKLDACRKLVPGDGSLADDFFPLLRNAGLGKHYDRWFEETYSIIATACKAYPRSHNSHNTAAWLASRAVRRLDDGHAHAEQATKLAPQKGAYIDTMAEVWFARGNRAKAIEWSEAAVAATVGNAQGDPSGGEQALSNFTQLHEQLERFKTEALPE